MATTPNAFTPLSYFTGTAGDPTLPGVAPSYSEQHGAGASVETLTDSIAYDGWGRVLSWVGKRGGTVIGRDTFAFDRMGNIKTTAGAESYNALGRLTSRTAGGWTYTYHYDAAGNPDSVIQVNGGTTHRWRYMWDVLNRLESVRYDGTLIARYAYDVLGRRIAKKVYSATTGGVVGYTRFVYHGDNVAFETNEAGSISRLYTWGMGVDNLIGVRDTTAGQPAVQYYAVKDKLGSVRGLVRRDGSWQYSVRFGPYGSQVEFSGTDINLRFRWTGREHDAESGLYYFRARYLDVGSRRFLSEDRVGYNGGDNLYSYVDGKVTEARDPSGQNYQLVCEVYLYTTWAWVDYFGWVATGSWESKENCRVIFTQAPDGGGGASGTVAQPTSPKTEAIDTCPQIFTTPAAGDAYRRAYSWSQQAAVLKGFMAESGGVVYSITGQPHYQIFAPQGRANFTFTAEMLYHREGLTSHDDNLRGLFHLHVNKPGAGGRWGPSPDDSAAATKHPPGVTPVPLATVAYPVDSLWVSYSNGLTEYCGKVPK